MISRQAPEAPVLADEPRPPKRRKPIVVWIIGGLAVFWLLFGLAGGSFEGKLSKVQKNDNAAYLPATAESTKVDKASEQYRTVQSVPGFIVYQRDGGLTEADKAKIAADAQTFKSIKGVAADEVGAPRYSTKNNTTASISVPLIGKEGNVSVQGDDLVKVEKNVIKAAKANAPDGLVIHSAGPGGLLVAFIDSFSGIDGTLLMAAGLVVILILLVIYRSPVLWFFPILSAVLALGSASLIIYQLAKHDVLTLNGQSQGILFVLVLGAGTDYALLLTSRYREELHNYEHRLDAMMHAWRGAAPAIGASGLTVILGLLCLSFGELNSDRSLGPVCAIGIACTLGVMLTFLPVSLLVGRWIFWPRIPKLDHKTDIATHGWWGRFAQGIARHARPYWIIATVILLGCAALLTGLKADGLTITNSFTNNPEAVTGQKIFDASFDSGAGAPAVIIANANQKDAVIQAASRVSGVAQAPGSVCVEVDYAKLAKVPPAARAALGQGCAPEALQVAEVDGRLPIDAVMNYRYDTPQAAKVIQDLRAAVHAVPGADAIVGGQAAIQYDTKKASEHDRDLIIPIVLGVILVVLAVLLRALVAPLLLILTVVLSFAATLGVSAFVFNHIFGFDNADPALPLFAFVFLVALGIDYNIFLMTRVREETLKFGTREGIIRGLAVTGGVITSAGVVLAATFTVLGVLPLVFLAEIGFAVAFGVLLDTILVRSILVPALSYDIGKPIWWPSRLGKVDSPNAPTEPPPQLASVVD
jgi:putative drug exporter of the RND superfamily